MYVVLYKVIKHTYNHEENSNHRCNRLCRFCHFLSPAANMAPGQRTGKFRLGKDELIVDESGESAISVEDYAVAMIDELEQEKHHKERFTLGY